MAYETKDAFKETDVSPQIINEYLKAYPLLKKTYDTIFRDQEFNALVEMSNIMAVKRLRYNDHGPVHARIVAGSSLEIFNRLVERGVKPSSIIHKTVDTIDEARLIVMLGALLHDIGNSIHRIHHEELGALLAKDLLDRVLKKIYPKDIRKRVMIRQEVMHVIHSTSFESPSLTVEAGCVKVGDGVDMSQGRARFPYKLGKNDIHAISALSIEKVSISSNEQYPVVINVYMKERAGIFQLEKVLVPKIETSGLKKYIDVKALYAGKELKIEY